MLRTMAEGEMAKEPKKLRLESVSCVDRIGLLGRTEAPPVLIPLATLLPPLSLS